MASGRSYRVQYSTKRANQVKRRPWTSPGSAGEIFDKLKSSVTSDKETVESALSEAPSSQEKKVSHYFDEDASSSTESSQELRKKVARDSKPMYSYSHYSRSTVPGKAQLKTMGTDSSSPVDSGLSPGVHRHSGATGERLGGTMDAKMNNRDSLKVFDFDFSDEDEHEATSRKTKADRKHSHPKAPAIQSRKQTLLTRYIHSSQESKQTGTRVARNGRSDGLSLKKSTIVASDGDIRNTLSKLLASKAEGLRAKVAGQHQGESTAGLPQPSGVDAVNSSLEAATEVEATTVPVTRRVKRKTPPTTISGAVKKLPLKKARIDRTESASSDKPESQVISDISGTSQSIKKNGIHVSGTLNKSEIATRTRASKREVKQREEGTNGEEDESSATSITTANDNPVADELDLVSDQDAASLDLSESPSKSSSTDNSRSGRPSPRYSVKSRKLSNVSTTSGGDVAAGDSSSGTATFTSASKEVTGGAKSKESQPKVSSLSKSRFDPYSFDDSSRLDKKPSMRKSSSYSLTSCTDLSDGQPLRSKVSRSVPSGPSSVRVGASKAESAPTNPLLPSLKKSSSWPQKPATAAKAGGLTSGSQRVLAKSSLASTSSGVPSSGTVTCPKGDKELYTVVRNVRQAHECLEIGESQQFFDEVNYLLDSVKPSQPLGVRCLGAFNLSNHYFDPEFSRQLRGHSFTPRITALLKDCLTYPTLCLSTSVLFYVMTRDKLNTEWDDNGVAILVGLLSKDDSYFTSELSTGKAQREMARLKKKAKVILQKANEQSSPCPTSPMSSSPEKGEEPASTSASVTVSSTDDLMKGIKREKTDILKETPHSVNTDNVSVQELACECLISLTQPQHASQWLRHQLRLVGGLDLLANLVISGIDDVCSVDVSTLPVSSQTSSPSDYVMGVSSRLVTLERRLKALEHVTVGNKDNQSYLVVFDGSVLLSKIVRLIAVFKTFMKYDSLRSISEHCLLTAFKVLLNLTHELQLGCYRLGEQKDIMGVILDVIFKLSEQMTGEDNAFDVSVLALSLLINLTEMCSSNRTLLEGTELPWVECAAEESLTVLDTVEGLHATLYGNDSALKVLVDLFLQRYSRAESTQIQVPTPQRLSQLNSSTPHSSSSQSDSQSTQPSTSKRDLLPSFTSRMQKASAPVECVVPSQDDEGLDWLEKDLVAKEPEPTQEEVKDTTESDEEEPLEKVDIDPLVFSREEFDAALHQAGRHMEDSIVAAYTALLLGILAKNNQETMEYIRAQMPSKSFSEMTEILKKLVSFMNMTGSTTGLESIRHVIKYLEAL